MLRTISAGMTALAVITGPSLGYAQTAGPASQRVTAADLNALTDGRVAVVKGALQLTPDQETYWPACSRPASHPRPARNRSYQRGDRRSHR